MDVRIFTRQMSLGPGSSIQVHAEVNPVTAGCPQQVNPTVNGLPPADKASIHRGPDLLLLAEGPSERSGRLLFLPLSVRWMRRETRREGDSI